MYSRKLKATMNVLWASFPHKNFERLIYIYICIHKHIYVRSPISGIGVRDPYGFV
jgi:hypothetical protein